MKKDAAMKKIFFLLLMTLLLTGCDWTVAPQPFPVWTPIPSRTPGIISPTPIILIPTTAASSIPTVVPLTETLPVTFTPIPPVTEAASATSTVAPFQAIQIVIIGCNTGLDITHGMGEVTNAYDTLKNTGNMDLPNTCGLLRAADEGRPHPDKTKCVDNLPAGYQVTFKLTVDSTFKESTIIQVDGTSNGTLLLRVDQQACTDLDLGGAGVPGDIGVIKPTVP